MNKLKHFLILMLPIAFFACSNDDEDSGDTIRPDISVTSPTEGQQLTFTDGNAVDVLFAFEVEDNLGLEEVTIWLAPPGGDADLIERWGENDFNGSNIFTYSNERAIVSPATGTYTVTIGAIDIHGNINEAEVSFVLSEDDGLGEGASITVGGLEDGESYLIGTGYAVSYIVVDEKGVEALQTVLTNGGNDTLLNQWYDEAYFTDEVDDATDFTISDQLVIPNTAMEGEYILSVTTYRGEEKADSKIINIDAEVNPEARLVNVNLNPPLGFDPATQVFISGDFYDHDQYTGDFDRAYELTYDVDSRLYSTSFYINPDHDFKYRYSIIDAEGNRSLEVDEDCLPLDEGAYNRVYEYADGASDINDNANFIGYEGC